MEVAYDRTPVTGQARACAHQNDTRHCRYVSKGVDMNIIGSVRTARMRTVVAVVAGTAILGVVAVGGRAGEFGRPRLHRARTVHRLADQRDRQLRQPVGDRSAADAISRVPAGGRRLVRRRAGLSRRRPHARRKQSTRMCDRNLGHRCGAASARTHGTRTLALITHGTFDPSGSCSSPCFFAQFTPAFFGPTAVVTLLSAVDFEGTHCNGSIVDDGSAGAFAGDITGPRRAC